MIKNINNKVSALFFTVVVLLCSGSAISTVNSSIKNVSLLTMVLFVLYVAMRRTAEVKRSVYTASLFVFLFMLAFTYIANLGDNLVRYVIVTSMIVTGYGISAYYDFDELIEWYQKVLSVLTIIALVGYFLVNNTSLLNFLPAMSNTNDAVYRMGVIFNYLEKMPDRNCSVFWEPGLYATFLIWGLVFNIAFSKKGVNWFRIVLYSIGIFTANSSAGFALWALTMVLLFTTKLEINRFNAKTQLLPMILIALSIVVILNFDAIIYNTGLKDNPYIAKLATDNIQASERAYAFSHNISVYLSRPLFGAGFNTTTEQMQHYADTSTSTYMMSVFGLLGALYTVFWIYGIFKNKGLNVYSRLVLAGIALSIINKEPHVTIMFSWVILFFLLKHASQGEDQFAKNTVVSEQMPSGCEKE